MSLNCHLRRWFVLVSLFHSLYHLIRERQAIASLEAQTDLQFEVYDRVVTEPTEESWRDAIQWARQYDFSHFLACVLSYDYVDVADTFLNSALEAVVSLTRPKPPTCS